MAKKKVKKVSGSRKVSSKKITGSLSQTTGIIVVLSVLCVSLFFFILALQQPQILRQQAQSIPGTNCRAAAGTCNAVNTCSTFETDGGQMDCVSGQTCCINPSTNSNPSTVPSATCLGSCTSPGVSISPTSMQQPIATLTPSPTPSSAVTQTPIPTATPDLTVPSGTNSLTPTPDLSMTPTASTTPAPSLGNNDLGGFINQLLELLKKLFEILMQLFSGGGKHSRGHNGGNK